MVAGVGFGSDPSGARRFKAFASGMFDAEMKDEVDEDGGAVPLEMIFL